jgi:hypothetical protein
MSHSVPTVAAGNAATAERERPRLSLYHPGARGSAARSVTVAFALRAVIPRVAAMCGERLAGNSSPFPLLLPQFLEIDC